MESFSESAQLAKVRAGLKGGPYFSHLPAPISRTFVDAWPPEIAAKSQMGTIPQGTITDSWNQRRGK